MKLATWGTAALAACLLTATAARLQAVEADVAEQGDVADSADLGTQLEQVELSSYNQVGVGGFGGGVGLGGYGSGGGGGYSGGSFMDQRMQLIVGVEYIYAQATFSDALAFVRRDAVAGTEDWVQYDFDYESGFGVYGGIYLPDCGGACIVGYRNLESSGDFAAADSANNFAPFELEGDISGSVDVDVDTLDFGMAKTIPLGCLQTCGKGCGDCAESCCSDPCNPCGGCGWCPAWDITFSGGVRIADAGWIASSQGVDPTTGALITGVDQSLEFEGIGGRVGLMGRRYIGRRGLFSIYARGDWSILFGDCDIQGTIRDADSNPIAIVRKSNDLTVPVTEIELGSTAHMGQHLALSAGWFWSAWHDLGMSQTYGFQQGGNQLFQTTHFDDANILGFTGLFARAELAF